ncbi:MAG: Signal transduction histidine-protein kinase/phosphatase DegS [Herbaspirillum frisingense]|uniref:Signal transduction histidine-protein kinase/phosphatase DegS n=1 Tax=Herbaspirillum frisingense TaxID=92645 RepID=A0A7V8FTX9_9BURK|nr:MAG: Signal transduction histidine-protein kinase/phosphatase DegS [Herbaspirillum frisingense]
MKLRQKIIFLAIVPLCLAFAAIALVVRHQAVELGRQQRATIEAAYLASKNAELQHYVDLATHALSHLYDTGRSDDAIKDEARRILADLEFGDDGYFFVYDQNGRNIMHPRQPELVGTEMWNWRDASGSFTIQHLIERANQGGGYERYLWRKPSSKTVAPKLGYVVGLPRWGWVIGTGIYLDDVETALAQVDRQNSGHLHQTMLLIAAIALLSALAVGLSGLLLNLSEHRVADAKLRQLAQRVVRSQEEERARLSRDLHDGISQWLVSIKLQIEAALIRINGTPEQAAAARGAFEKTAGQINGVLAEVRRISHDLRPAILDDLGLAAALEHLCGEWRDAAGSATAIVFDNEGDSGDLPDVANTVLFRVAQEALTNIARHAEVGEIRMRLYGGRSLVMLQVIDNGRGFDPGQVDDHSRHGIGLRNMRERLEAVGGELAIDSSPSGTRISAVISRHSLFPHPHA